LLAGSREVVRAHGNVVHQSRKEHSPIRRLHLPLIVDLAIVASLILGVLEAVNAVRVLAAG
jgi:hypothetical protein